MNGGGKKSKIQFSGGPKVKRSGIQNRKHSQTKWSECCPESQCHFKNCPGLFYTRRNQRDIDTKYISQTWIEYWIRKRYKDIYLWNNWGNIDLNRY